MPKPLFNPAHFLTPFLAFILVFSLVFRFSWDIETQLLAHLLILSFFLVFINYNRVYFDVKKDGLASAFLLCVFVSLIGNHEKYLILLDSLVLVDALLLSYLWKHTAVADRTKLLLIPQLIGACAAVIGVVGALASPQNAYLAVFLPKNLIINAGVLAGFFFLCFCFSLNNYQRHYGFKILTFLLLAGIILTRSRVAAAAAFLSFASYYVFAAGKSRFQKILVTSTATLLALVSLVVFTLVKSRQYSAEETIFFSNRFIWWDTALEMFRNSPLNGVGWGNYGYSFAQFKTMPVLNSLFAHNLFLQMLAETGLLGALFFVLLFAFSVFKYIKLIRDPESRRYRVFNFAMLAAVLGLAAVNMTDFSFYIPAVMFLFFIAVGSPDNRDAPARAVPLLKPGLLFPSLALLVFILCLPLLSMSHYERGLRYFKANNLTLAENEFLKSSKLNPISSEVHAKLAEVRFTAYTLSKDKQLLFKAISDEQAALMLSPRNHLYWSDAAWLFWASGDRSKAIEAMKTAVAYDRFNQKHINSLSLITSKQ